MNPIVSHLDAQFGSFPEPVIFLYGEEVLYTNEPGTALLEDGACPPQLLAALAEHPSSVMEIALEENFYRVTVSPMETGDLLVLRPMPQPQEGKHPFSNAVYKMREYLTNLTAIQWRLKIALDLKDMEEEFRQDFANQSRCTYQMLRLVRQAELTNELDSKRFPMEEAFDMALVCEGMAEEAKWLADLAGVKFTYASNVDSLPFKASKSLLTQMLLALVSNSIRAAGREGSAEMRLHAENGRCVISLRDSGAGIPEDRLSTLFSGEAPGEIPRPGEGAGLGLYNARRIAQLHGGTMIAQSGLEGGSCVVVSLPVVTPRSVPLRNNPGYDNLGGYSPVMLELSDILPWQAFVPKTHAQPRKMKK